MNKAARVVKVIGLVNRTLITVPRRRQSSSHLGYLILNEKRVVVGGRGEGGTRSPPVGAQFRVTINFSEFAFKSRQTIKRRLLITCYF